MGRYLIKDLEQLSGIKAHTIRIWEKRHQIIDPQRTESNIRYYSDQDLKKIISVSLLNNNGFKISRIAEMSPDDINKKVLELSAQQSDLSFHIDQLVLAMVDMEEEHFEKILSNLILRFGFEKTITGILYPFLEKIGVLWQTHNISPAQEHFISNLIRQKIIVAIDSLPLPSKNSKRVVLFLPEKELHEIGLLFYHFIVRQAGYRTYYLGQHVPHSDLIQVVESHKPSILITSLTVFSEQTILTNYLTTLSQSFSNQQILVSGGGVQGISSIQLKNIRIFKNSEELKQLL